MDEVNIESYWKRAEVEEYLEKRRERREQEQAIIQAFLDDPETKDLRKQIREGLKVVAVVWLAELAQMFAVWGFDWQEPTRAFNHYPTNGRPDRVTLTWQHPTSGKHVVVLIDDPDVSVDDAGEAASIREKDISYVYYGFGTPRQEKYPGGEFDGDCRYPALTYLLWYWYFH